MATAQLIESNRVGAEVYYGAGVCTEKYRKLLEEFSLPRGLMPLETIEEFGFNRSSGFIWLKQPKKMEHKFKNLNQTGIYDTEITFFIEKGRMKKVTGSKGRQFLITAPVNEIFIGDPTSGKITFTSSFGISMSYPISSFEIQDQKNEDNNN